MFKSVRRLNVVLLFFFETEKGPPLKGDPFCCSSGPPGPKLAQKVTLTTGKRTSVT